MTKTKKPRATKNTTELINLDSLQQDIDDYIVRLNEMKTRTEELRRLKETGNDVPVYGMPSWRLAQDKIDAALTSLLKSVSELKKSHA